ncbi:hypothetical protein CHRYSEOSP005_29490 [Chryseobacterium sp. Alg-005]|uniref:hypothetical protein n=1 Tax=Chryseobacterium sp. Alg-005 TaxID=3159516 RepID=UPI0035559E3B
MLVGIEVARGDIPSAQVTSVRGSDGTDGEAVLGIDTRTDKEGNIMKRTFSGTNLIALTQIHTHNIRQEEGYKNIPGTSDKDKNTASSSSGFNIPIHAIDSYTGANANGNAIHRVLPNGKENRNIGTTINQNIGQDALKMFIDRQKNP